MRLTRGTGWLSPSLRPSCSLTAVVVEESRAIRHWTRLPHPVRAEQRLLALRAAAAPSTPTNIASSAIPWSGANTSGPTARSLTFSTTQSGRPGRFINAGVNGLFPLAFEGLLETTATAPPSQSHPPLQRPLDEQPESRPAHGQGRTIQSRRSRPAILPRIPCYKADLNQRLAALIERHFAFSQWANHLQMACFEQKTFLTWTLAEEGSDPPRIPNAYKNPFAQITLTVPSEPARMPNADRKPTP